MPKNTILNYFSPKSSAGAVGAGGDQGPKSKSEEDKDVSSRRKRPLALSDEDDRGGDSKVGPAANKRGRGETKPSVESSLIGEHSPPGSDKENAADVKDRMVIKEKKSSSADGSPRPLTRIPDSPRPEGSPTSVSSSSSSSALFTHLELDFLQPDRIRDRGGRRPGEEGHEANTLKVPKAFLEKQTPAQRQWWEIKSQNFDTVLFFKMGKFYETFHMDAVLTVRECGLAFMKKEYAHAGFPEGAFYRFANLLIDKGHKVARIEQVETPKMMEERCRNQARPPTKFDKVVRRDICEKITVGTRTFSEEREDFLVAIVQRQQDDASDAAVGVTVLNTSLCKVHVGQFRDDHRFTKVSSILSYVSGSAEVIFCKSNVSSGLLQVLERVQLERLSEVRMPMLEDGELKERLRQVYGRRKREDENEDVQKLLSTLMDGKNDDHADDDDQALMRSSFFMVAEYLREALVDHQVFSLRDIAPLSSLFLSLCADEDEKGNSSPKATSGVLPCSMLLPANTIENLDIMPKNIKGRKEKDNFSLFALLDHSSSQFGRRTLTHWVCHPLARADDIRARQKAIQALERCPEARGRAKVSLRKMCDFERHLARISAESAGGVGDVDAEKGAIFYNKDARAKANVQRLLACLDGLEGGAAMLTALSGAMGEERWEEVARVIGRADWREVEEFCRDFRKNFDFTEAAESGQITPAEGVNPAYDSAKNELESVKKGADAYLKDQRRYFQTKDVNFFGAATNAFQLEVPDSKSTQGKVTDDYVTSSRRKGFTRYLTPKCLQIREEVAEAEEAIRKAIAESNGVVFGQFCSRRRFLSNFVFSLSALDSLLCLHQYSYNLGGDDASFPDVQDWSGSPVLRVVDGRHPLLLAQSKDTLIPNDLVMGGDVFVLSGANMGGKSTVMRQTGLLVLLAQLGCRVPAKKMEVTAVDKLLTRMGAADNMLGGESTLMVELSETAKMLSEGTGRSLLLIDELGRGTATHDGCAIARAVIEHLAQPDKRCLCMVTTHYHQLLALFSAYDGVKLHHMDMVEPDEQTNTPLTFLYKVKRGPCSKSHGFNAASCAGVAAEVVAEALRVAREMEQAVARCAQFSKKFLSK